MRLGAAFRSGRGQSFAQYEKHRGCYSGFGNSGTIVRGTFRGEAGRGRSRGKKSSGAWQHRDCSGVWPGAPEESVADSAGVYWILLELFARRLLSLTPCIVSVDVAVCACAVAGWMARELRRKSDMRTRRRICVVVLWRVGWRVSSGGRVRSVLDGRCSCRRIF